MRGNGYFGHAPNGKWDEEGWEPLAYKHEVHRRTQDCDKQFAWTEVVYCISVNKLSFQYIPSVQHSFIFFKVHDRHAYKQQRHYQWRKTDITVKLSKDKWFEKFYNQTLS